MRTLTVSLPALEPGSGEQVDKDCITIALPKGRLFPDCRRFFLRAGVEIPENAEFSRKLVLPAEEGSVRFIIVRDKDLPTYVDYGAADIGIVGKDVLMEAERGLLEPLDLGFGQCRIVLAEPTSNRGCQDISGWGHTRVATKYPKITARHFASKGEQVEVIPLYGSIELAPLVGLAERIVDLVSTGETLRENNLVEIEEILKITARLVVNRASLKIKAKRIVPLIEKAREQVDFQD
jgi:ATP phosphoribosyltransferase